MGKKRIPFGWGVPLGCAAAMMMGGMQDGMALLCAWLGCGLLTFCAPDTLRRASSRAMNDEMLGNMMRSAAFMILPAVAVAVWLEQYRMMIIAGLLLVWMNINQSLMEARRDRLSLILLDVLAAAAIIVALVAFPEPRGQSCLFASEGLALLGAAFGFLPMRGSWRLSADYFREIPLSLLRNLVWPMVGGAILWLETRSGTVWQDTLLPTGFAMGCVIMEICRPMFRLSRMEGGRMRRMLPIAALIVFAAGVAARKVCPSYADIFVLIVPAMGCALCGFGPMAVSTFVSGILLILPGMRAVWMGFHWRMEFYDLSCVVGIAIALLTTIPDWKMFFRLNKAKRMRKRK